jgi:branched-subunit amino acid aminotransferase/4-amino-4-deoxychorismate lyase
VDYRALSVWVDRTVTTEAAVSVWDHGLLYGGGCFEGMRLREGLLFRPYDHLARLRGSARALAKLQANAAAAGDAIMLDTTGTVAEATSTNVFVVLDGTVATPTTRSALPGITCKTSIELLGADGLAVVSATSRVSCTGPRSAS